MDFRSFILVRALQQYVIIIVNRGKEAKAEYLGRLKCSTYHLECFGIYSYLFMD